MRPADASRALLSVANDKRRWCSEREVRRERASSGFDMLPDDLPAQRGSHDTGDPHTTNLYVGNLAATVDEHTLKVTFGKFGPVASVKIMWPRDDEQRMRSGRMTGFVSFMTRHSAEQALEQLQGYLLHDSELHLGWSKAVPLPAVPCWPPANEALGRAHGFSSAPGHGPAPQAVPPPPPPTAHSGVPRVEVRVPATAARLHLIDVLASYVALDGCAFEQAVAQRECDNSVCSCHGTAHVCMRLMRVRTGLSVHHGCCVRGARLLSLARLFADAGRLAGSLAGGGVPNGRARRSVEAAKHGGRGGRSCHRASAGRWRLYATAAERG